MIDREIAIQWAKDAGFLEILFPDGFYCRSIEEIQALITRAQNEAREQQHETYEQWFATQGMSDVWKRAALNVLTQEP